MLNLINNREFALYILIGTVMILGALEGYPLVVAAVAFCLVGIRLVLTLANREVDNAESN